VPRPKKHPELEQRAIARVRSGEEVAKVATDLGFSANTVHSWVRRAKVSRTQEGTTRSTTHASNRRQVESTGIDLKREVREHWERLLNHSAETEKLVAANHDPKVVKLRLDYERIATQVGLGAIAAGVPKITVEDSAGMSGTSESLDRLMQAVSLLNKDDDHAEDDDPSPTWSGAHAHAPSWEGNKGRHPDPVGTDPDPGGSPDA
jgi:transposase-like protein